MAEKATDTDADAQRESTTDEQFQTAAPAISPTDPDARQVPVSPGSAGLIEDGERIRVSYVTHPARPRQYVYATAQAVGDADQPYAGDVLTAVPDTGGEVLAVEMSEYDDSQWGETSIDGSMLGVVEGVDAEMKQWRSVMSEA